MTKIFKRLFCDATCTCQKLQYKVERKKSRQNWKPMTTIAIITRRNGARDTCKEQFRKILIIMNLMDGVITSWLGLLGFPIPFLIKYVDCLILAVNCRSKGWVVKTVLSMRRYSSSLRQKQIINNSVPFLDTLVIRNNDNKWLIDIDTQSLHPLKYILIFYRITL